MITKSDMECGWLCEKQQKLRGPAPNMFFFIVLQMMGCSTKAQGFLSEF